AKCRAFTSLVRPWMSPGGWEATTSSGPGRLPWLADVPWQAELYAASAIGYSSALLSLQRVGECRNTRPPKAQTPIIAQVPRTTSALPRQFAGKAALWRDSLAAVRRVSGRRR